MDVPLEATGKNKTVNPLKWVGFLLSANFSFCSQKINENDKNTTFTHETTGETGVKLMKKSKVRSQK